MKAGSGMTLLNYADCQAQYGQQYHINKALGKQTLYKIEKGIYSDIPHVSKLAIIQKKYSSAILTLDSAFYFHGMTDDIPDVYYLATASNAYAIKDTSIKQIFVPKSIFELGKINIEYNGININIYDKERMLIELIRYKNKLPYDYYKEIIYYYRKHIDEMEIWRIQEYAEIFPKSNFIRNILEQEVF